jgi:hypothetical protein
MEELSMTISELVLMSQGDAGTALMLSDSALAIMSGYLLIAYFIGAKLTLFQASFVNCIFILVRFVSFLTLQGVLKRNQYWIDKIQELDPSIPYGTMAQGDRGSAAAWAVFIIMTGGALLFMWQVRHPKNE